jgi:hypothetical protein
MNAMAADGTAAAVVLELAQMTRALREAGIRATADYTLGAIVISWGKPPNPDTDEIRRSLVGASGEEPVSEDAVLISWAAQPRSEADALTAGLQAATAAIAPGYATPARGSAGASRRDRPQAPRPGLTP